MARVKMFQFSLRWPVRSMAGIKPLWTFCPFGRRTDHSRRTLVLRRAPQALLRIVETQMGRTRNRDGERVRGWMTEVWRQAGWGRCFGSHQLNLRASRGPVRPNARTVMARRGPEPRDSAVRRPHAKYTAGPTRSHPTTRAAPLSLAVPATQGAGDHARGGGPRSPNWLAHRDSCSVPLALSDLASPWVLSAFSCARPQVVSPFARVCV